LLLFQSNSLDNLPLGRWDQEITYLWVQNQINLEVADMLKKEAITGKDLVGIDIQSLRLLGLTYHDANELHTKLSELSNKPPSSPSETKSVFSS